MSAIGLPDLDRCDGLGVDPIPLSTVLRAHAIGKYVIFLDDYFL